MEGHNMFKPYRRQNNRLSGYDYSQPGYYYVTICTHNHIEWLGNIENGRMRLNINGHIVQNQWQWLVRQYPYIAPDVSVVMPNHIHGILTIRDYVGNGRDRSLHRKPLSELIGAFKTTSSKLIHQHGTPEFKWQKSFYDHIIRNYQSLQNIRQYIITNPHTWPDDRENTGHQPHPTGFDSGYS